jgi:hypothetical protein
LETRRVCSGCKKNPKENCKPWSDYPVKRFPSGFSCPLSVVFAHSIFQHDISHRKKEVLEP